MAFEGGVMIWFKEQETWRPNKLRCIIELTKSCTYYVRAGFKRDLVLNVTTWPLYITSEKMSPLFAAIYRTPDTIWAQHAPLRPPGENWLLSWFWPSLRSKKAHNTAPGTLTLHTPESTLDMPLKFHDHTVTIFEKVAKNLKKKTIFNTEKSIKKLRAKNIKILFSLIWGQYFCAHSSLILQRLDKTEGAYFIWKQS